jgi:hypothetical protein
MLGIYCRAEQPLASQEGCHCIAVALPVFSSKSVYVTSALKRRLKAVPVTGREDL